MPEYDPYTTVHVLQQEHTDSIVCLAFSSCGHYLASGSNNSTLAIWDVRKGVAIKHFVMTSPVLLVCWDIQSSCCLFCGCQDGVVTLIWDILVCLMLS
ncbi:hypothetical protein ID866_13246 [Astraeus odoratus]|nr:hypothetical protein ID866_13246 [Astraeus odoratus]